MARPTEQTCHRRLGQLKRAEEELGEAVGHLERLSERFHGLMMAGGAGSVESALGVLQGTRTLILRERSRQKEILNELTRGG